MPMRVWRGYLRPPLAKGCSLLDGPAYVRYPRLRRRGSHIYLGVDATAWITKWHN